MKENFRNFIIFNINNDLNSNISYYNVENNFNLQKLKNFCLNWNLIFFDYKKLKKIKVNFIESSNKRSMKFYINFTNIWNFLNFINENKNILEKNIKFTNMFYKNSYINIYMIKKWLYLKNLNTYVYLNYFLKIFIKIYFKLLFYIFYKFLNLLRNIYIPCLNI